jgi:hypothetical protein
MEAQQVRSELVALLDALVSEREASRRLRDELSQRAAEVQELSQQYSEARAHALASQSQVLDLRAHFEGEVGALQNTLEASQEELRQQRASSLPPRDLALLREEARRAVEAPLLERVADAERAAQEARAAAAAAARECKGLEARAEVKAAEAAREADAAAEAHLAAVGTLQARAQEAALSADEAAAAAATALRLARADATQGLARAAEAEREADTLRSAKEGLRVALAKETQARNREVGEARAELETVRMAKAAAERAAEAAQAESAALSSTSADL